MMKRILSLSIAAACMSLAACGDKKPEAAPEVIEEVAVPISEEEKAAVDAVDKSDIAALVEEYNSATGARKEYASTVLITALKTTDDKKAVRGLWKKIPVSDARLAADAAESRLNPPKAPGE